MKGENGMLELIVLVGFIAVAAYLLNEKENAKKGESDECSCYPKKDN
jgi:hypothetical protein